MPAAGPALDVNLSDGDKFSKPNARRSAGLRQKVVRSVKASTVADESFNSSKVATKLRDVKVFENLGESEIALLAKAMTAMVIPCNEWVFEEGKPGDALFVIKSGTASVLKLMEDRYEKIADLQQWSTFGERALIKGELRFAGVQATSDPLELLTITREGFKKALGVPLKDVLEEQQYDPAERAARRERRLQQQNDIALQANAKKQRLRTRPNGCAYFPGRVSPAPPRIPLCASAHGHMHTGVGDVREVTQAARPHGATHNQPKGTRASPVGQSHDLCDVLDSYFHSFRDLLYGRPWKYSDDGPRLGTLCSESVHRLHLPCRHLPDFFCPVPRVA